MLLQNAATHNPCVCGKLHGQDSRSISPKSYATFNSERFGPSQVRTGLRVFVCVGACVCVRVWPSLSAQASVLHLFGLVGAGVGVSETGTEMCVFCTMRQNVLTQLCQWESTEPALT